MNTVSQCLRSLIFVLAMAAPSSTVAEDAAAIIVHRLRQSCSIAEPGKEQAAYENANQIIFYLNRGSGLIDAALRSSQGSEEGLPPIRSVRPPAFDGQWVWSSAAGKPQPSTGWFDGLMQPDNPHLGDVIDGYRRFATTLRNASCLSCHVPSNPAGAKTLFLLQTPAHAAGEIRKVL